MSIDDTPPHVTALLDQQQATMKAEDEMPKGVIAQVRVRRVNISGDMAGLAASFDLDIDDLMEAAALLITLEEVAQEFGRDVAGRLKDRAAEGPDGMAETFEIMQRIVQARQTKPHHVQRFSDEH